MKEISSKREPLCLGVEDIWYIRCIFKSWSKWDERWTAWCKQRCCPLIWKGYPKKLNYVIQLPHCRPSNDPKFRSLIHLHRWEEEINLKLRCNICGKVFYLGLVKLWESLILCHYQRSITAIKYENKFVTKDNMQDI